MCNCVLNWEGRNKSLGRGGGTSLRDSTTKENFQIPDKAKLFEKKAPKVLVTNHPIGHFSNRNQQQQK
jgi:hypothetical protein